MAWVIRLGRHGPMSKRGNLEWELLPISWIHCNHANVTTMTTTTITTTATGMHTGTVTGCFTTLHEGPYSKTLHV